VTTVDDSGAGSLRQAILDTPPGGTVDFQEGLSGTITLTTGELLIDKDLTITGPGADVITVSGNGASRVFEVTSGVTAAVSGLTIANGRVTGVSAQGGGIFNAGTLTVTSCTLSGNVAISPWSGSGGAIANSGTLTVTTSTLSGNGPAAAGAGLSNTGTAIVTSSTISSNDAHYFAGGIGNSGTLTVTFCTLSGNGADYGGGIYNSGTLTVTFCTLSGNGADYGGGLDNVGTVTVTSSTFSGNSAAPSSAGGGGGIVNYRTVTIRNTLVAGNTARYSPAIDLFGTLNSDGYNLIGDGTGGSGYAATDLVGTADQPIDPKLGPLQDNGGPTLTMALLPGSPAIDAGDNTDAPAWDQRGPGYPRVVNGTIDIGAFEVQAVAPTVTSAVATSLLWPPNDAMVNVGLSVTADPAGAPVHVLVYANDDASAADAADIGAGTLQVHAERQGSGEGRVYLVVATASNPGGTGFDVCTVAVPHDLSWRSLGWVGHQAAAAKAYYREFQAAPPGFLLLGESPDGGGGAPSPSQGGRSSRSGDLSGVAPPAPASLSASLSQAPPRGAYPAARLAEQLRPVWASLPADRYFATAREEGFGLTLPPSDQAGWGDANASALDLVLREDWLAV
jgi:hypothetical protein